LNYNHRMVEIQPHDSLRLILYFMEDYLNALLF
jgi:hypothetical protein